MSDPSLRASDPVNSAWVAANAGAGKTHTLANRVTRLLLSGAKPERILCLTYTKAAAAEMQERLFNQLGLWAMLPDETLAAKIAEIGAGAEDRAGLRKARRLFAQALETPGGLKIQTIHAFCQNVLSRFSIEAGVPPSFRVLDERSAQELMDEARARVLERAGSGDAPRAAAIAHLVTQTDEKRLKTLLDAALGADRRKIERFFNIHGGDPEAAARAVRRAHGAEPDDTEQSVAQAYVEAARAEEPLVREIARWLRGGGARDVDRAARLEAALGTSDPLAAFELFREAFCTTSGARYESLAAKKLATARPDLLAAIERLCEAFVAAEERYRAARAAGLCEATLAVAEAVREVYASEKRLRGALDYDDLIAMTLKLLERSEAASWVLYKLDGGLDHILVDEAQDTSPEQWAILRLLTEEHFSWRNAERGHGTLFAVGDEKQSIFSFQGADPTQFDVNRRFFKARVEAAELPFADETLAASRRSAPEILAFVDAVFADPEARRGLTSENAAIAHIPLRRQARGLVEIWPTVKPAPGPEPDYWRPVDVESEKSPVARFAAALADRIRSWTDGRTRLPGKDCAVRPGDIMILLPRREPFGGEIVRKLKERGVPVAGADRIVLTEQMAVMDLIALGRFALLAEDDLNCAALLRSPLVGLGEEELFALSHGRTTSLWRALTERRSENERFEAAHGLLAEMRARADYAPPFEFYARALGPLGLRKRLLERLGHEANDPIDEFLALALSYESENTPSLQGFLHSVERGGAKIKRDMERGRDEVRVMTVHGAKGLEADIVILPDTTGEPPARVDGLIFDGDGALFPLSETQSSRPAQAAKDALRQRILEERRRLLYVALTRPKERLYIGGFERKRGVRPQSWYALASAAAERCAERRERDGETIRTLGTGEWERVAPAEAAEQARTATPPWALEPARAEVARPRLIRPSDAGDAEEPAAVSPKHAGRFRRGLLVHDLLARLPEVPAARRREAALDYLRRNEAEDAEAIAEETIRVLSDPVFAPAFAPGSRAEIGLVADLPEIGPDARVHGRIDRIAVTETEALIVDFKTNRAPPEREEDVAQIYRAQMALYRAAARKIFPGRRIACALAWTDGPLLTPLSDALLDAEIARLSARLAAH
jgi:ATP-dependent helicase/nuclease subunit A